MHAHTHTDTHTYTQGDYKPGYGQLSWFHYVKAESLECIAADNDMMIRGFRGKGGFVPTESLLMAIANHLCRD